MSTEKNFAKFVTKWKKQNNVFENASLSWIGTAALRQLMELQNKVGKNPEEKPNFNISMLFSIAIPWGKYDAIMEDVEAKAWCCGCRLRSKGWTTYHFGYNIYYMSIDYNENSFVIPNEDMQKARRDRVKETLFEQVKKYNLKIWVNE